MSFGEVNRRFYDRKFRFTVELYNAICDRKTDNLPPQMTIFSSVISIITNARFHIFPFKMLYCLPKSGGISEVKPDISQ